MKWTRRVILRAASLGLVAFGTGGAPAFLGRLVARSAAAGMTGRRRTLVAIFQRGAMDGLMAVPPLGDEGLQRLRPRLAMSERDGDARVLDLGGGFGLHPAFEPLLPAFRDECLAIVHGVGSPNKTRSHFDAQDYMETGTPFRKGTPTGWLNRALGELPGESTPFRAVSLTSSLPRSLYGPEPALAVRDLTRFRMQGHGKIAPPSAGFESLYEQTTVDILHETGRESFDAMHTLDELDAGGYTPAAEYPSSRLGRALKQIAFLVKARVGLEIAFAESDGWDTHVQQGTERGAFSNRAGDLAGSVAAFWEDLGRDRDDVVVMTMTEFGRTVAENGSGGTDHGRGSCLFVLGASVNGGRVHGEVPRLRLEELEDGRDLPVTTDFRSVFADVVGSHLGLHDGAVLFPGWEGARSRLFR